MTNPRERRRIRLKLAIVQDPRPSWLIAKACDVSPTTLSAVVSGRADPSASLSERLAETLGCEVTDIFDDDDLRGAT